MASETEAAKMTDRRFSAEEIAGKAGHLIFEVKIEKKARMRTSS